MEIRGVFFCLCLGLILVSHVCRKSCLGGMSVANSEGNLSDISRWTDNWR